MTKDLEPILQLEIQKSQTGGLGGKTSAEMIEALTPEKTREYEVRLAEATKNVVEKKQHKKESKETLANLPSDVATQETKAVAYFKENNEANNLKVVDHVKKLRAEGKIIYEDLGGGKYAVIMPWGSKKLKMYFPADTTLADTNYNNWHYWTGDFKDKAISRTKLWSKEGQKYLKKKETKGQKLLLKEEFQTLIQTLYPEKEQEEQILAFMIATGFYGRMVLADREGDDYQRAVQCSSRVSTLRDITYMNVGLNLCSLVHSTFIV